MRCDVITKRPRNRKYQMNMNDYFGNNYAETELPCNSTEMEILHEKCKSIIRQCTVSLLSSISLKDFHDIEEDLTTAICSYLKCEKYYQDYKEVINMKKKIYYNPFLQGAPSSIIIIYYHWNGDDHWILFVLLCSLDSLRVSHFA